MSRGVSDNQDIAIVGMAVHLPGAASIGQYWENLSTGVSSIRRLDEAALQAAGETPERMHRPDYVPAAAPLEDFAAFDPAFFGFSPRDAAILDPQHRHFLEVAWEAFENASHAPGRHLGPVGVYAGCGMGSYFYFNICSNPDLVEDVGMFLLRHTGNDKDFLTTRLSHIFDLTGPSVNVQTACSTSLVAVHYAVEALRCGDVAMAVAGGVTIELPNGRGYLYEEGGVLSPDGECHAFDHRAKGTVFGSGAGAVVLRRLDDALADGDHIWAVIKGTAINNDGAGKASYLAPSLNGQADAVAQAILDAGVTADTIGYVECHGTGTYLGDPIEVAALTAAFRETTTASDFCRIGSVKTNIGHLDTAAGVASLIKAALALHHRKIPPSLGYEKLNPVIALETSPFRVADHLMDWISDGPRRAGVNSLGVGGTNAYAVLEEAPERAQSAEPDWPFQVFCLSGHTKTALDANAAQLAAHLRDHPGQDLADVAFTLKEGRKALEWRRAFVAGSAAEAATLLETADSRRVFTHRAAQDSPEVAFLFPGGGAQYAGMARDLYETEPVFREWMDRGLEILTPRLDYDLRALWLPAAGMEDQANQGLMRPSVQLPLIAMTEYAMAQLWISWGIRPTALAGHSMGENVAASIAGVLSFEDMIGLVYLRGQSFDRINPGGMLSVALSAEQIQPYLGTNLDLAAINAPDLSVASGPAQELADLAAALDRDGVEHRRIAIDIAAHSRMLAPILEEFRAFLAGLTLSAPTITVISNLSGQPLTATEARDPDYWTDQLRQTVRFADCVATLAEQPGRIFLECGPGRSLTSLTQSHPAVQPDRVIPSLRHADDPVADDVHFLGVFGRLWAAGIECDWDVIWGGARRNRVPLPTYAFQRADYFIEPGQSPALQSGLPARLDNIADWGWRPTWHPAAAACEVDATTSLVNQPQRTWLIFMDEDGIAERLARRLTQAGHVVVEVHMADAFSRVADRVYTLAPEQGREGYDSLIQDLLAHGIAPTRIVHGWLITRQERCRPGSSFFHHTQEVGFYSLMFLAQALGEVELPVPLGVVVLSTGALQLSEEGLPYPEKATVLGPVQVIPREFPSINIRMVDFSWPKGSAAAQQRWPTRIFGLRDDRSMLDGLVNQILEDLLAPPGNGIIALRGARRFEQAYAKTPLPTLDEASDILPMHPGMTWLITGGFSGIGLSIAETLAAQGSVQFALLGRTVLPPRADWPQYLRQHAAQSTIVRQIAAIERLEGLGARVLPLSADVSNIDEMRKAVGEVNEVFGSVNGVIHAAGHIDDAPMMAKTQASIEQVFAPKIHGTQILTSLFPDGALEIMVLCSSSSTATAPAGQIDYVAANQYLNAVAESCQGGKTRVLAIAWGIWQQVGMAARAIMAQTSAPAVPVAQPLFTETSQNMAGDRLLTGTLSPDENWILNEHRMKNGQPVLPGTAYLEFAAQALEVAGETVAFEIRDLFLMRPCLVGEDQTTALRVRMNRSGDGYGFEVQSAVVLDGISGWQNHAQGQLLIHTLHQPEALDLRKIAGRCQRDVSEDPNGLRMAQEAHLNFGKRWRVVNAMRHGDDEGIAWLSLDERFHGDLEQGYRLHPALMDLAIGWAMGLVKGYRAEHLWVPVSYQAVRVYAPLPPKITSWVRIKTRTEDDPFATFDVTITDPDGGVCVEILGFSIRQIDNSTVFATPRPLDQTELELTDGTVSAVEDGPGTRRLRKILARGIQPEEGGSAFLRALALPTSRLVISSIDLDALIEETGETVEQLDTHRADRPETSADYMAPRTDLELTLAGIWEELLGIDRIGIEDNFFDLGGHSLIAVRLFARIRKTYQVDLPISVLFESPTIATSAALIQRQVGTTAPTAKTRRFTHLVPMHEGAGGSKTPVFLAAGMFGNVLNLRHLAHLMGSDRQFYGLQARGLYDGEVPHATFQEAAADYIAELKQVQPDGPYILGGFSGGGLIAWEMAQQLTHAGDKVALLALLDTPMPVRTYVTKRDKLNIHCQELVRKGLPYLGEWLRRRFDWEVGRLLEHFAPRKDISSTLHHNSEIEVAFKTASAAYQLTSWNGPVTLFRPPLPKCWQVSNGRWVSHELCYISDDNGWGDWTSNLTAIEVPGNHDSMVLEPHVRVLASYLAEAVAIAEAEGTDVPPAKSEQRPIAA